MSFVRAAHKFTLIKRPKELSAHGCARADVEHVFSPSILTDEAIDLNFVSAFNSDPVPDFGPVSRPASTFDTAPGRGSDMNEAGTNKTKYVYATFYV
ncbi:hypothetical protein EVAR_92859_1 [Eumeta japonica]|uniref:Uncharacterized protein n=1 Tax=Eumeta variegata TaxID=151549 RepID=A0A4C1TCM5_EUMVA|nr:hypothetical protein EVAR_92859_1 [Eumeta japonica]